jgi:hypothetical protein
MNDKQLRDIAWSIVDDYGEPQYKPLKRHLEFAFYKGLLWGIASAFFPMLLVFVAFLAVAATPSP